MTNQELKRQTFLEATRRVEARKALERKQDPAKADYEDGKISWNEYLKRSCEK